MDAADPVAAEILPEDRLRAVYYQLLARFLAAPPDQVVLDAVSAFEGDATELGQALGELAEAAARTTPQAAAEEYHVLFIGIGRGELVPYASYYLTGFLNEKPLAKLRADMARLGIARAEDVREPEDHIAALCEMMAGLITGAFGRPLDLTGQRAFFEAHVSPWAEQFFSDLEAAPAAAFYASIGALGRAFMGIEAAAIQMEA